MAQRLLAGLGLLGMLVVIVLLQRQFGKLGFLPWLILGIPCLWLFAIVAGRKKS